MKTRLTTALLGMGSWFRNQLGKPICWLFGHNYWITLDKVFRPPIYICRRCGKSYDPRTKI